MCEMYIFRRIVRVLTAHTGRVKNTDLSPKFVLIHTLTPFNPRKAFVWRFWGFFGDMLIAPTIYVACIIYIIFKPKIVRIWAYRAGGLK